MITEIVSFASIGDALKMSEKLLSKPIKKVRIMTSIYTGLIVPQEKRRKKKKKIMTIKKLNDGTAKIIIVNWLIRKLN